MNKLYILDACALIALLSQEEGSDKVSDVYNKAASGETALVMNIINLLEVYYGDYRAHGKEAADKMIAKVKMSSIRIIAENGDGIFSEAGRLKASYKISLADAVALAQAAVLGGTLITADHHELDVVEIQEKSEFYGYAED